MVLDVCSTIDKEISPSQQLKKHPYKVHRLLNDIVSGDLDADRMDYLLRDSHMCGVNYGLYDPDRILKSMCAYARRDTRTMRVAIRYSGVGALEDLLLSRYQMHGQIYGHKTNRACNAMLGRIRERLGKAKWTWYGGCRTIDQLLNRFKSYDDTAFVGSLLKDSIDGGAGKVREIAEKLFKERRLYKRVYEERVTSGNDSTNADARARNRWRQFKQRLLAKGIPFAEDVFENKGPNLGRQNYPMKILRKHPATGYYLVHELRDFSSVVQYLPDLEKTYRIYCKRIHADKARITLARLLSLQD
jgi:hypothetical protein